VTDKIVAIPTASQFRWSMMNIGTVDIMGCDVKASGGFVSGKCSAALTLRYTFQKALDHTEKGSLVYGNQIPYIPRHSGSAAAEFTCKEWKLLWNTIATGERWSRTANISDYHIAPWTISDVTLSRRFAFRGGSALSASVSVDNIFNTSYEVVQGYPMPGTGVMVSLAVEL